LLDALGHSHQRVRRTAATLLGSLGAHARPALARLVRCCLDRDARVAAAARETLRGLACHLPAPVDRWLSPLYESAVKPAALLADPSLPEAVRQDFQAMRQRRQEWQRRRSGKLDELAEMRWQIGWLAEQLLHHSQGAST
jgi:hypothetical protein